MPPSGGRNRLIAMDAKTETPVVAAASPHTLANRVIGMGCALLAVSIWGAWIVSTRHAVHGHLPPFTVGWLRFVVPAVVLAPWWIKVGPWPKRALWPFLVCFLGSGGIFFFIVGNAMRFVPAADVGPLLPGTMPLIVALVSFFFLGEKLGRLRWIGFACIAVGVFTLGGRGLLDPEDGAWRGHLLLLTGAAMWAGYVLAFRRTGMSAPELTGLVGLWSFILFTPLGVPGVVEAINAGYGHEVLIQLFIQGIGSGVVALVVFGVAIQRLGSSRAAAFTGLVPALAAAIAIPMLGEHPDAAAIIGVVATGIGVALASGAFRRG